jgi:O-succinylbenzoic acid--CoA ligase
MTETAAQVTMLSPAEFLAGRTGVGRAMPHAEVAVVDEFSNEPVPADVPGRIRIRAGSLFRGYHREAVLATGTFLSADRGTLSSDGSLHVLGRLDAVINTGGEKVDPAAVEAAIRATALVRDVAVIGVPDAAWGEIVVAVIAGAADGVEKILAERLRAALPAPARPKRWVRVAALPRNGAGKLDRAALRALTAE